jgi:hypothetical protein
LLAVIHEALERPPCLDERDPGIIDYLTTFVPRVLLVAGSKGERGMNQIAIDVVELQSPATGLEGGCNPLGTMIGVP